MNATSLYKINDVVDSEFIRFPLALLANAKYKKMSLESKVVYSLLLNRLTLSQRNGWLNDKNEVYLIYTREETAETLGITYKKSIAAFKELISYNLIVEQRRGRGFANIIYVVKTDLSESDAKDFSEQFDDIKADETAGNADMPNGNIQTCQNGTSKSAQTAHQDLSREQFKICQAGTSRTSILEVQDMPELHTSKIDNKNIDPSYIEFSQSVRPARACEKKLTGGQMEVDEQILEDIFDRCEFHIWDDETVETFFKNAIERLYYSECVKIGNAVLPQGKVRSYLNLIDAEVIIQTYETLRLNRENVKNTTAYIMSVLFNNICEKDSGVLINLPPEYLNHGGDG